MKRSTVIAVIVVALAAALRAQAAPPPPVDDRAEELFQRSHRAYRDGDFQLAVDLLLEARKLRTEPVLLYDLGRAYEALGRRADAADAYARFLEEAPTTSDRRAIEGRIATLHRQVEEEEALRRAAAAARAQDEAAKRAPPPAEESRPSPAPATERSATLVLAPWVVGGVGLAALGTGAAFGVLSRSRYDDAKAEPGQAKAADLYDGAKHDAVIANVALISGAVLVAAAGVWLVVRASGTSLGSARTARPLGVVF
jgi:tetratricopeptide (TPR) repeat protein